MPSLYGYAPVGALAEQPSLEQMLGQLMQPRAAQMSDTQVLDSMGITRDQLDRAYQNPNTILPMGGAAAAGLGGAISGLGDIIAKRPYQDRSAQSIQSAQNAYAQGQQRTQANEMGRLKANMAIGQQRTALQQAADTKRQNLFAAALNMYKIQNPKPPALAANMEYLGLDPKNPAHQDRYFKITNQGKGANVTIGQPGEGDAYNKSINTALGKKDADFIISQRDILQSDELAKIGYLETLNEDIDTSGFVGTLLDAAQNAYASIFPDSKYQLSSETPLRDLYTQISNTFVLDEAARQTGVLSDGDILLYRSVTANLGQSKEGRKFATSFMRAVAQRRRDAAEQFLSWKQGRMDEGKQPSQSAWLLSDEFKALKKQSLFDSNPDLLVQIYGQSTSKANKRKIMDMRIDQLEKQGITDEVQISDMMKQEGFK